MEPTSPTHSLSSSSSATFEPSNFASLPILSMKEKIVEKIRENRVTLIVGEAGCGKSSQVPQFLLEENMEPVLCTQPRRLAVVAIAKVVAKARNCELGAEVGYHIGHSKLLSPRSKILFKTAGVLLDEMRDKGASALKYKVIILDEVHERSVESDLVLVCVKQFLLKNSDLRVVLMSATADISRYRDYFKDLGRGERVQTIAIPSSCQQAIFQRRVTYLEQVSELLGISSESLAYKYCSGYSPSIAAADMERGVHKLIYDLVVHIHKHEPDIEKGILIFLPTYFDLEQQWSLMKPLSSYFKVHILHRSIDIEQALMAMKVLKSHRRVILATNIAESSVTIPQVAYVIDPCRSLQVFWDNINKKDSTKIVWISKSQADQRKGRTGRTCDGHIYRLVTRSFFNKLEEYESPTILKLSLRQQVLLICCAQSRAINDPKLLLQKAMDSPDPEVIEDAINLLVRMNMLVQSARGRYEPTFYGRLLGSLSLTFDASILVLKFGDIGLLHEGILLGILMDTLPLPILHPFGQKDLFTEYAYHHFGGNCHSDLKIGQKEMNLLGNFYAYQFWQHVFKDKHRLEYLTQPLETKQMEATTLFLPKIEEEWCSFHNLVQSSLHHVSDRYEDILNSVHLFRPKFLGGNDGLPSYYDPCEFLHTCELNCQPIEKMGIVAEDEEETEPSIKIRKCLAVPFVNSGHFGKISLAEKFSKLITEIRVQDYESTCDDQYNDVNQSASLTYGETPVCVFFTKGSCKNGNQCTFSHSIQAKKPACKFFFTLQGCRNGETCFFAHNVDSVSSSVITMPSLPEEDFASSTSLLELFPASSDGCILLLDDTGLHFAKVARHFDPCKIITTTCVSESTVYDPSLSGMRILWGIQDPYQTIISKTKENSIPWSKLKCILWLSNLESYAEDLNRQKILIQNFFKYLGLRILSDALYDVQVILTMDNIRFSQLQVEKLGRESFFVLRKSFRFDEASFGHFSGVVTIRKPMLKSKPICYVFDVHPPADIQSGNYAAIYKKLLHDIQGLGSAPVQDLH